MARWNHIYQINHTSYIRFLVKRFNFIKNGEFWSIFNFIWMMKITIFDWFINHHFYQITKNEYFHVKNSPFGFRVEMICIPLTYLSFHTLVIRVWSLTFSIGGYFLRNFLTFSLSMSSWLLGGITLLYKHKGVITKF